MAGARHIWVLPDIAPTISRQLPVKAGCNGGSRAGNPLVGVAGRPPGRWVCSLVFPPRAHRVHPALRLSPSSPPVKILGGSFVMTRLAAFEGMTTVDLSGRLDPVLGIAG